MSDASTGCMDVLICATVYGVLCCAPEGEGRIDDHIGSCPQVRWGLLCLHNKVDAGSARDEEKSRLVHMLRCIRMIGRIAHRVLEDDGAVESGSDETVVYAIGIDIDDGREQMAIDDGPGNTVQKGVTAGAAWMCRCIELVHFPLDQRMALD